jgi:hypothetical protein
MAWTNEQIALLVKLHLTTSVWTNRREGPEVAAPHLYHEGWNPFLGVRKAGRTTDRNIARWSNEGSLRRHGT